MKASTFFELTPDRVLDAVEGAIGAPAHRARATGRSQALNSLENRVYEIELEDGDSVVAKFYRPGRWNEAQIAEEHAFADRLKRAEVPAVAPLELYDSPHSRLSKHAKTLAIAKDGILFTVFPRVRARIRDELPDDLLHILGRFLARLHAVGAGWTGPSTRVTLDLKSYGHEPLHELKKGPWLKSPLGERYRMTAERVLNTIPPYLTGLRAHRVHGDCHLGNILWQMDAPFFVDLDDMVIAPPVQDIWMIVRGDDEQSREQRRVLIEAYEEMRPFDHESLHAIEPLRALRLIHYSAWIARRWDDPSFPNTFPQFGSDTWWLSEIEALERVLTSLENYN